MVTGICLVRSCVPWTWLHPFVYWHFLYSPALTCALGSCCILLESVICTLGHDSFYWTVVFRNQDPEAGCAPCHWGVLVYNQCLENSSHYFFKCFFCLFSHFGLSVTSILQCLILSCSFWIRWSVSFSFLFFFLSTFFSSL